MNNLFNLLLSVPILVTYFVNSITCSTNCSDISTYQTNLENLLSILIKQTSSTGYYTSSIGQTPDQVYARYLCRGDSSPSTCSSCLYDAHATISGECPSKTSAIIWVSYCMLVYSNEPFSDYAPFSVIRNPNDIPANETQVYKKVFDNIMGSLAPQVASSTIKYGTNESNVMASVTLYSLGQCTPDLSQDACDRCLKTAIAHYTQIPRAYGARVLQPSCIVWYEFHPFYDDGVNTAFFLQKPPNANVTSTKGNVKRRHSYKPIIVATVIVLGFLVLLSCAGFCIYLQKRRKQRPELEEIIARESLQFDFRTVREATNNFSIDNKLGQGGFGAVYKGRLENGQVIAVKRLSINSGQGIDEFKTEVLLLAKLQHNNLVKLLGFCIHLNEKLLIYEFLSNGSLDKVVLDSSNHYTSLDWDTRYKILVGIARGLLYLHEDSRLKIIHRDLKSSNILLDQSMNPKIADFGLARLVGTDQIQAVTSKIMGTYGYMPPEYTRTGRFSIKTDVYSFGIIILEILSGHKCNSTTFPYEEESLLKRAWRLWNEGTSLELVDDRLNGRFLIEEVTRCIHIGLLCIQEDPNKRPTMTPIVSALNGHLVAFSEPEPPQEPVPTDNSLGHSSIITPTTDITDLYPR